ncbi:MAG: hypothetical protein NTU44_10655 [Bacteroidetes bacterium]|nr:hypothetical protein [Bacteroidota bacterium]
MKKYFVLLVCLLSSYVVFSQSPEAFKYQAVTRGIDGNVLVNQDIQMRLSILAGDPNGGVVYSETHNVTTNEFGLVTLNIGGGTVETGEFSVINWGNNTYYLKIEADETGGSNFQWLGTSQLLSVPYALYAAKTGQTLKAGDGIIISNDTISSDAVSPWIKDGNSVYYNEGQGGNVGIGTSLPDPSALLDMNSDTKGLGLPRITDDQRDAILNPKEGLIIYNVTTGCLNVRRSINWFEICPSGCVPQPTPPVAGPAAVVIADSVVLQANTPLKGIGTWSVALGGTGNFSNIHSPTAVFKGSVGYTYVLDWTISTSCLTLVDETSVTLCFPVTQADAGPDQLLVSGSPVQLAANVPGDGNTGMWTIISGINGMVIDPANPVSGFTGVAPLTYTLVWTITNNCGMRDADTMVISFDAIMGVPCPGTPTVVYGGQTYNTVKIGSQCWLKENLNIGTMINSSNYQSNNGTIEKYCYSNDLSKCTIYGGLYQWNEMMAYTTIEGGQGICPTGWHIPTDAEFCTMLTFIEPTLNCSATGMIGTNVGGKMRETGTTHWSETNTGVTNISGFTALGSGYWGDYSGTGTFYSFLVTSKFRTSVNYSSSQSWSYYLTEGDNKINRSLNSKTDAQSVRCIKD